jgi:hypothetical protein
MSHKFWLNVALDLSSLGHGPHPAYTLLLWLESAPKVIHDHFALSNLHFVLELSTNTLSIIPDDVRQRMPANSDRVRSHVLSEQAVRNDRIYINKIRRRWQQGISRMRPMAKRVEVKRDVEPEFVRHNDKLGTTDIVIHNK